MAKHTAGVACDEACPERSAKSARGHGQASRAVPQERGLFEHGACPWRRKGLALLSGRAATYEVSAVPPAGLAQDGANNNVVVLPENEVLLGSYVFR